MIKKFLKRIFRPVHLIHNAENMVTISKIENLEILAAKALILANENRKNLNIQDYEFKVFSQWGDDGIIQFLIRIIDIPFKTFVEFGVQDYSESNTRFLLMNNNWDGYIMDGSKDYIDHVKKQEYYWRFNLTAKTAFITAENINQLLRGTSFQKEIGIYHIDIDGNDYWIWKHTTEINPVIVIVEYQSVFGCSKAITTPYQSDFVRSTAHYSNLYYGASILALCDLAEEKGYYFVGCNSAGNNAYFVRKDKIGTLKPLTASEGYVCSKFRESRNESGDLTFLQGEDRLASLKGMSVFNIRTNNLEQLG